MKSLCHPGLDPGQKKNVTRALDKIRIWTVDNSITAEQIS